MQIDENKNGQIIKVILGSRVAGEGLDFKNIRDIHILEPWYNLSRIDQAVGRAIRNCSHIDLPFSERNVNVYLYVASAPTSNPNRNTETNDEYMYRKAEKKDIVIKNIEYILHQNSVDCLLNKKGNILTTEKINEYFPEGIINGYEDGSRECMYNKCDYSCNTDESSISENKDTFDISFLSRKIQLLKLEIKKLFTKNPIYSFDYISENLKGDKDLIYYTLIQMVEKKKQFLINLIVTWKLIVVARKNEEDKYVNGYFVYQPDELSDDHLPIRWRNIPLGWNPGKIDLPSIDYSKKDPVQTIPTKKDGIVVKQLKITKPADSYLSELETLVFNLQKNIFNLNESTDFRKHKTYDICVGAVLDSHYTLVSNDTKIGRGRNT